MEVSPRGQQPEAASNGTSEVGRSLMKSDLVLDVSLKSITLTRQDPPSIQALIDFANRAETPLRLEELNLAIHGQGELDAEANRLLNVFLAGQAPSLRKLEVKIEELPVGRIVGRNRVSLRIPRAEHVRVFELSTLRAMSELGFRVPEYEGGSLAKALPFLERLVLDLGCFELLFKESHQEDVRELSHRGVTELKLRTCVRTLEFALLPLMWPNVTRLHLELHLGRMKFPTELWTIWPALVSLRVRHLPTNSSSLDLDEALSGIPKHHFKTVKRALSFSSQASLEKVQRLQRKYKTQPGISDLYQLREFVFVVDRESSEEGYTATDIAGYFGFAMASPGMQRIVIENEFGGESHNDDGNAISSPCRQFMRSVFSPYTVIQV